MIYSDLLNAVNNQSCVTGQLTLTSTPSLGGILLSSPNGLYIHQVLLMTTSMNVYITLNVFSRNTQTGALTLVSTTSSPNAYSVVGQSSAYTAGLSEDGLRLYVAIGNGQTGQIGSFLLNQSTNTFAFINYQNSYHLWTGGGDQQEYKKIVTSATSTNSVEIVYYLHFSTIATYSVNKSTGFISTVITSTNVYSGTSNLNACVTSDNKYLLVSGTPRDTQSGYVSIYYAYLITYTGSIDRYYGDIRVSETNSGNVCQIVKAPKPNIISYEDTSDHFYILTTQSIYFLKYTTSNGMSLIETYTINNLGYLNRPQSAFYNSVGIPKITRVGEKSNLYYRVDPGGVGTNKWGNYRRDPFTGKLSPLNGMIVGAAYNSDDVCIPIEGGHVYTSSNVYKQSICDEKKSIFKPLSATLFTGSTYLGSFTFTEDTYSTNFTRSSFKSNSVNFYEIGVSYLTLDLAPIYSPAICVIYSGTPTTFSNCQPQAVRADSTITHSLGGFTINITYGPPTNSTR